MTSPTLQYRTPSTVRTKSTQIRTFASAVPVHSPAPTNSIPNRCIQHRLRSRRSGLDGEPRATINSRRASDARQPRRNPAVPSRETANRTSVTCSLRLLPRTAGVLQRLLRSTRANTARFSTTPTSNLPSINSRGRRIRPIRLRDNRNDKGYEVAVMLRRLNSALYKFGRSTLNECRPLGK